MNRDALIRTLRTRLPRLMAIYAFGCHAPRDARDSGQHLIRRDRLGLPRRSRAEFTLLVQALRISAPLAASLRRMVGFRNVVVHDGLRLQPPSALHVIEHHLADVETFASQPLADSKA